MRGAPAPASAARRRASRGNPRARRALRPVAVSGARGRGLSAAHPVVRIDLPRGARDRNRADCAQARSVRADAVREWRIRAPASRPARRRVSRTGVRGGARCRRPSCIERRLPDRRQYSAIPCGGPSGMRRHRRRSERAARRATSPRGPLGAGLAAIIGIGGWARARLSCRASVGRGCAVRSAARGARRPSATAAERRATGITYSCIAHRSSRGRESRAASSASCVRFVCRLGESTGEMTNEPAGETVSESMGETAARTGWRIGSARRADGRVGRVGRVGHVGRAYRTRVSNAHAGSARRFSPSNRAHAFARCPACAISRHS